MARARAFIAGALALCAPAPAAALDPDKGLDRCTVKVWRSQDGIPSDWIRGLAQTAEGYLLVATPAGLARFDGVAATGIDLPGPHKRRDIVHVTAARNGAVWLAPIFEEPIEVASGRVQPASSFPGYKRGARLRSTFEDPDGTLWFATAEGLYRFSRGAFSKVPTPGLAGAPAVVARDRSGRLWVGSAGGLFTETGEGGFARASAGGEAAALPVTALAVDRAGHVWAATAAGLVRGGRGEAAVFRGELRGASALVEDRDGNLWIGTASGLVRFRQGRFETYTRTDGLPDDWVTALLEDREGTLWVGTRSGGLAAFSDRTLASLAIDFGGARPTIHALCEDAEGALWLGTADDGLLRVAGVEPAAAAHGLGGAVAPDAALRRGPPTRVLTTRDGLLDDGVPAVHPARGGGVWVGTRAGLQLLRGGVFTRPAHVDDEVTTLREDREGGLWIGGRATLARFHDGRLRTFGPQDGFDARDTRAIYEDSRGAIWVNTMKGVLRYAGGRFSRPPHMPTFARAFHDDGRGSLWVAAPGMLRVRLADGGVDRLRGPFPLIYQMLGDDRGDLWLGTLQGIARVRREAIDHVLAGRRDDLGLVSFDMSDRRQGIVARAGSDAAWRGRGGRLYFATEHGVVVVDPSRVRTNADPPPVVVERALVDGSPLRERSAARVGPGSRTIEMHYAALSFVQPRRIRYRHRLHGFDDRWIDAGPRRSARYTNLPPGRYAFRVQARSADGVWNENGASFALELAPHFHETPWFWGLCALAALAAAAGGYRLRLRQLRARYATILAERARVARGLHDNLLQALSGVAMQLDAASEGLPPAADDARRRVDRARGLVAQSLEEARRTVWDLRGQAASAGDLAAALARLADRIADGGAVSCHVRVEGEPRHLAPDLKQELFQIGKEAIANALTHAGASRIDARLRYRAGGVTLAVRDDGRGFDPDRAPGPAEGHFGLVGMRERAARVAARLAIRSRPGEGTEVEVDAATPAPGASRPWPRAT